MKSITTALLTLGMTCGLAISGFSQNHQPKQQPMNMEPTGFHDAFMGSPNRISVGGVYQHTDKDPEHTALNDSDGSQWGFALNYDYYRNHHLYFGVSFNWVDGDVDGNGSDTDIKDLDTQIRLGYTWVLGDNSEFFITPFIGFGYRNIQQSVDSVDSDDDYVSTYLPIGFRAGWWISKTWELGLNAQWRWDFDSTRSTDPENTRYELDMSNAWEFELPITYRFESENMDGFDLRLVPFFKWTSFGQAKDAPALTKTTFDQWGARLELGYRF